MSTAIRNKGSLAMLLALFAGAIALLVVLGPGPQAAKASSHREAPLIANDPTADNTDVYAFVSPDRPDTVTMIANYIPLEDGDPEPEHVPLQHGADQFARRSELEHPAVLFRHARYRSSPHRARVKSAVTAEQHRPALDAELPQPRHGGGQLALWWDQGFRRSA